MTVALIDDDAAVLDSLKMILTRQGIDVACFASADEFVTQAPTLRVDCVVSDVKMPGRSGIDLQNELNKSGNAVPLILITGHGDVAMAVQAIKHGAFDFLEKPFDADKLVEIIRRAVGSIERRRLHQGEIAAAQARVAELTQRQRQVMDLVVRGRSNKEIAIELGLSPRTVENYRAWVMEKMGTPSLAALVRLVVLLEAGQADAPPDRV